MKKFIYSLLFFILPFGVLFLFAHTFYLKSGGDLNKLGKISVRKNYREVFELEVKRKYTYFSEIELSKRPKYDVLTIGDSFSDQGAIGYQNFLGDLKVIHFDWKKFKSISNVSPLNVLYGFLNSNVLRDLEVKYIVVENVVREIVRRGTAVEKEFNIDFNKLKTKEPATALNYWNQASIDILKFPIFNVLYHFDDNAFFSPVYRVPLSKSVFTLEKNELLFFHEDIDHLAYVSREAVSILNKELNLIQEALNKYNIKLIVLAAPDKYDLYHKYIEDPQYPPNLFFNLINNEEKDYVFIESKKLFLEEINKGVKDVYFADDTHWSPVGIKVISDYIVSIISDGETK